MTSNRGGYRIYSPYFHVVSKTSIAETPFWHGGYRTSSSYARGMGIAQNLFTLIKNFLMPLFLMGCFPVHFQEVKRPLRTKSGKHPIEVGKRPVKEGKRPIKAMVLVGVSVACLMGCFRAPPPWRKTAPLKRPIKRSMN